MRRILLAVIVLFTLTFTVADAQQGGTFVASLGAGLTSAQSDFNSDVTGFSAGGGFGMEASVRYYLWGGFSIGGMVNFMRFGSSYPATDGRLSFQYSQMGGLAKMNFIHVSGGKIYLCGGGGVFTPSAHYYVPDNSTDITGPNSGYFGFGGIGLASGSNMKLIYELELRYNMARADYTLDEISSNVWDFIYVSINVSFASKGKDAPPRY